MLTGKRRTSEIRGGGPNYATHPRRRIQVKPQPLVWLDEKPVTNITRLLAVQRGVDSEQLNLVTGISGALLVAAVVHKTELYSSVPGPHGLPGGYPVRLHEGTLQLVLPRGLSLEDAIKINRQLGRGDGVDVHNGMVRFTEHARAALGQHAPDLVDGFPVTALQEARAVLENVRRRLRLSDDPNVTN